MRKTKKLGRPPAGRVPITLKIHPELNEAINRGAAAEQITRSEWVESAVKGKIREEPTRAS